VSAEAPCRYPPAASSPASSPPSPRRAARAAGPPLTVEGIEHVKLRAASAPASAVFYRSLFGGDVIRLRNSTLPSQPRTDEFFLKIGPPPFPYLMLAQIRNGERPGIDHISLLAGDEVAARRALEAAEIPLYLPKEYGVRLRGPDGTLIELMFHPTYGHARRSRPSPA
jgi:catechol 2,3-dioxygenase-like lactoylglutathione lyase family enzyme